MKNEDKIVEFLSEMLHKFDVLVEKVGELTGEVRGVKDEVNGVKYEVKGLDKRLSKVEDEIVKNLISSENSRGLLKLADNNDRINRLEKAVFK